MIDGSRYRGSPAELDGATPVDLDVAYRIGEELSDDDDFAIYRFGPPRREPFDVRR